MDISTLFYFLLSSIALTIMPGPDNLYLLAKSISDGAKQGVTLAAGLASGIIFHTALVIFGVAAVIASTPEAFLMLKYLGAFYLFYLARQAYSAKPRPMAPNPATNLDVNSEQVKDSNSTKNNDASTNNSSNMSNTSTNTNTSANTNVNTSRNTGTDTSTNHSHSKQQGLLSGFATYRKGLLMNILNPKVLLFFLAFLPQFVNPTGPAPSLQVALLGFLFSLQAFIIFSAIAMGAGRVSHFLNQSEARQIVMNKIQGLILIIIGGLLLFF
ncbi:LysE family translocator [uncultured Veillonella sp.]|uniref:LysE family translocator n=1 Tax=uncultured Veillonella sp. TaxID=159268 RepID=UPI0025E81BE4|nr:LysE family translocator [uncultured Veillonella sp.]